MTGDIRKGGLDSFTVNQIKADEDKRDRNFPLSFSLAAFCQWSFSQLTFFITCPPHIGTLQCAEWFHSRNGHTVPSHLDSRNAGNPGMALTIMGTTYGAVPYKFNRMIEWHYRPLNICQCLEFGPRLRIKLFKSVKMPYTVDLRVKQGQKG